jgi:glycosyltransferase involved in cell wall biosynthesis
MMRIFIDATIVREGGHATYIRHILPELLRQSRGHEYHLFLSSLYQGHLIAEVPEEIRVVTARLPETPVVRWWSLQTLIPQLLRAWACDVFFSVAEISTIYSPCPSVILVRNINFFAPLRTYPRFFQRLRLLACRVTRQPVVSLTLRHADRLIFVSESFLQAVLAQRSLPREKAKVIYHGVNPIFFPAAHGGTGHTLTGGKPYLLSVASLEERKNFETLVRGFARLVRQCRDHTLQLVIAGSTHNTKLHQALLAQTQSLGLADRVHFVGRLAHDSLASLYRQAQVFVLPSRLETFGHPLVEAMVSGVAVVASDLPVCREICQDAARYFPPDDVDMLVNQVSTVLGNLDVRHTMVQRGLQRARAFSWEQTAAQLVEVFEELGHGRPGKNRSKASSTYIL